MLEGLVAAILAKAVTEKRHKPSVSGFVRTNPAALTTRTDAVAVPDFFPVASVAWPAALLDLWKTMRYASLTGVFVALSRAWFTVDNRLVLWDYRDGREFTVYDEIPELISVVGTPLRPVAGTFQPHVTYILPVATTRVLFLLGICVVSEREQVEMRVVNLGYSCVTPAVVTRIVGFAGRIFCAAADGSVYEVEYMRENSLVKPKIRMVTYNYWLSSTPVLGQVSAAVGSLWETWTGGQQGGLIDLAVDEREGTLLTLSERSTIGLWRLSPTSGLRYVLSLRHRPDRQLRGQASSSQREAAPLMRLFVTEPDAQGCRVCAVALNGDQFRYRYVDSFDSAHSVELRLQQHTPSFEASNKEVSVCYASSTVFVAAFTDAGNDRAADELLAATISPAVMKPHDNVGDVVTSFSGPSSRIVRVDAIEQLPYPGALAGSDLSAQVCFPGCTFLVVHRHGLSFFAQARPVDTLYLILSSGGDADCRNSLLERFRAMYGPVEYAAMLFQIAIDALNVTTDRPHSFSSDALLWGNASDEASALSELGQRLSAGDDVETIRRARDLLRTHQMLDTTPIVSMDFAGDRQQCVVPMSFFAAGLTTFVARAVGFVWDVPLSRISLANAAALSAVLTKLIHFLDSLGIASVTEQQRTLDLPHQWQQDRVTVSIPQGRSLRNDDMRRLLKDLLCSCYELAHKALQTATLLSRLKWAALAAPDASVTFAQVLRDAAVAQRIGKYVSETLFLPQPNISGNQAAALTQLQQQCPYFFSGLDTQASRLCREMDALTRGNSLHSYTETQMLQWVAEVGARAATYWSSGALQSICEQLRGLKRENVAVELLLHAAAQMDPSHAALNLFLADTSEQPSEQVCYSTAYATYQTKLRVLELVVAALEAAWLTHRSVVDDVLGGPRHSGTIWQIEPADEFAHCFLFDWLQAPRDDKSTMRSLRETLVSARSPFLASYLRRNAGILTKEYAHYLAHVQGDYKAAMQQCVAMAQSPLLQVPEADRLGYRLRCLREALECAQQCQSDQRQQVEQELRLLEAQRRMYRIATAFISSGDPDLYVPVALEGMTVTQLDVARQHISLLATQVLSGGNLLAMAGMYASLGGGEVQLDVLKCTNVSDPTIYATCVASAYQNVHDTVENITRRLVNQYYTQTSCFPLFYLVRRLEAHAFLNAKAGSPLTVQFLGSLGIDAKVLFLTYEGVLKGKDDVGVECAEFAAAGVTQAYLVHSHATVLLCLADLVQRGSVPQWVIQNAMAAVRTEIEQTAVNVRTRDERVALDKAEELLSRAHTVAAGGMAFF